jgi:hypothetical protein
MKTKVLFLFVLATFLATATFATNLPSMKITPVKADKTILSFENNKAVNFELTVSNFENEIIYYKKSEAPVENYKAAFDFSNLENGSYHVTLTVGNWTLDRKLTVKGSQIEVGEEVRLAAPVFLFEDNMLQVSFLNMGQKNVFLNIYKGGDHVTGKKLGNEICVQKVFDLSKLNKGLYEVVLTDKYKTYTYYVNK